MSTIHPMKSRPIAPGRGVVKCSAWVYSERFGRNCYREAVAEFAQYNFNNVLVWKPVCAAHLAGQKRRQANDVRRQDTRDEEKRIAEAAEKEARRFSRLLCVKVEPAYSFRGGFVKGEFTITREGLEELAALLRERETPQ